MKKLLFLLIVFVSVNTIAQPPDVIIARGDTIETVTDTTWFYSYDTNFDEIKMVRLNSIYGSGGGAGDVTKVGTPVNNELGVWTGDGTLEGESELTFNNHILSLTAPASTVYIGLSSDGGVSTSLLYQQDDDVTLTSPDDIFIAPTGTFRWGSASITEANLEILDGATLTTTELNYIDGVTSSAQTQINGKADTANPILASDTLVFMTDTLTLGASVGVGNAGDTLGFTDGNIIWAMRWDGTHTMNIKEFGAVSHGTTPDVDLAVLTDINFRDGTPTEVLSADLTVTSTTTGNNTTSFADATITPGDWIWLRIDQATFKPTQLVFYFLYNKTK